MYKRAHFFGSCSTKFTSLSHVHKKVQFFELYSKRKVHFCESYSKKGSLLRVILKRRFKSLSHNQKKEEKRSILSSHVQKSPTLWVTLEKRLNSSSQIEKKFNSLSHVKNSSNKREVQFFEHFGEKKVQFFETFDSLRHIEKRLQLFESSWKVQKKGSFLWVILKNSFVWVFFSKKKEFNSLSHNKKRFNSLISFSTWFIFWVIFKKNSLSHTQKKGGSILWVIFKKGVHTFESYQKTRVQFFESCWNTRKVELLESYCKKTSTLWVTWRRSS